MAITPFLPLPAGWELTSVEHEEGQILVHLLSTAAISSCPLCHHESERPHSSYLRTLADLPCAGQSVCLKVTVHRFRCDTPECARKIFTERIPTFVRPWSRMTLRLVAMVQAIGLATTGEGGSRLGKHLGISPSPPTILRRVMDLPCPLVLPVTALGIDDFSFRRGRRFGTILVDLDRHTIIDLLPERSAPSAAAWMRHHPEIAFVSRDRGAEYTQGATAGAPQAIQIADRFHLAKNLVEAIESVVLRCCREIRQQQPTLPDLAPTVSQDWRPAPDLLSVRLHTQRLASNQQRYDEMIALYHHGLSVQGIADQMQMTYRTVHRWLRQGCIPHSQARQKHPSLFDAFAPYVLQRWAEGCHNVGTLWQEMHTQGFTGNIRTVYRFVRTLRQPGIGLRSSALTTRLPLCAHLQETGKDVLWLVARQPKDLTETEQATLTFFLQAHATLNDLYHLVQSFGSMLRERHLDQFAAWKAKVTLSGIVALQRFAAGLERNHEEVVAALTYRYSNGQVEGFVNKVKMLKRMMFGRANFLLLRQRVLHAQ